MTLSIRGPLLFGRQPWAGFEGLWWIPKVLAMLLIPTVVHAAWRLTRQQRRERAEALARSGLMDTVLATSREWLWATNADGYFTFCGPASRELLGYEPAELLGRHLHQVIGPEDLAALLRVRAEREGTAQGPRGSGSLVTAYRHRDGRRIPVEVSARAFHDGAGQSAGYEGTSRALAPGTADVAALEEAMARVAMVLATRALCTAFQPVHCLSTGTVLGAEALTRFPGSPCLSPETWFREAAMTGLGVELEIMALETALRAALGVPAQLYVAVNLSPEACLDPRLIDLLAASGLAAGRIMVEITERHHVHDYAPLTAALESLRRAGVRLSVDDAGAGFASMRHILELKPDVVKLDRGLIAGIDADPGQRALGAAMVGFAGEIGASLVAEGIETEAELATVTALGMGSGQGYLLGRPTTLPEDWARWQLAPLQDR
ncbi:sensor domain-containing phosphodiesterase [Paeniglutamicibacter cryotolerans]|uniref:PAS domain S-box-containing protein n=1 Tax=Paeniglutamicibacter cryotolerans TaxID=670079 RepID=A0A839QDX3_9MICC|nr:EAL domain-containing protein [Paeniglutamicibacter cryotolerans]MBB2994428.1 PAS domain S-box-containing protein [Paeniglutamicibacter cryotolerans]